MTELHGDAKRMREASGNVDDESRLVCFLYVLLRGHITPGILEEIMDKHVVAATEYQFCNGWLAIYARDIAQRLTSVALEEAKDPMIQITATPWMHSTGRTDLTLRVEVSGRKIELIEILEDDWLTAQFDQIWKTLGSKTKEALEEERAVVAARRALPRLGP